jgi:hypothetical protein
MWPPAQENDYIPQRPSLSTGIAKLQAQYHASWFPLLTAVALFYAPDFLTLRRLMADACVYLI